MKWRLLQVMSVSHLDVLREEAYMLFYVRHPKLTVRTVLLSVECDYFFPGFFSVLWVYLGNCSVH